MFRFVLGLLVATITCLFLIPATSDSVHTVSFKKGLMLCTEHQGLDKVAEKIYHPQTPASAPGPRMRLASWEGYVDVFCNDGVQIKADIN